MARYVNTTDNSLGAKILGNGKALVAREINGTKVVEIVNETNDIIDQVAPVLTQIINKLVDFFNSVFHRFPTVIVIEGNNYIYTQQPAPFKAIDKVFYLCEDDPNYRLFEHEAKNLPSAKRALRKELKEMGYMS